MLHRRFLAIFHCFFFVLLGFVFPCNTLTAICLSRCQPECFSCMELCLGPLNMTDSQSSRLVLPDPGESLETCAAPFPNGWGLGGRVCLLEVGCVVIDCLPLMKGVCYARGRVLGNNLRTITLIFSGTVFHIWISLLRIFSNEAPVR